MTEVADLLRAWMEESKKQEERRQEDRKRYEEEQRKAEERRVEERKQFEEERRKADERYVEELRRRDEAERRREAERQKEREEDRKRYEDLIKGIHDRRATRIEVGPESLKLTKLSESEDVEAFLTAFERAVEAHGVERDKWAVLLAPQLTGKALQAYAAMGNEDAKKYEQVKEAIFRRYDINEETYRRRFRSATWRTNEAPVEMLTRITDLAGKWLKSSDTREKVMDSIVKEQFINVLPEEARIWVKERKPGTSKEAGTLAEDFRQARKETWESATGKVNKRCHICKMTGHLARDCTQRKQTSESKMDPKNQEEVMRPNDEEQKQKIVCFKCKARGHIARNCPKALFCHGQGRQSRRSGELLLRGEVEGHSVKDIQLDTGCTRTVVRSDLVDKRKIVSGESVTIQCAHGDVVSYPLARVDIAVAGKRITVEAAVSDTLPRSVLLGTDVQELSDLLGQPGAKKDSGFVVVTRSRARQQQQEEKELQRREKESGAKPTTLESLEESESEKMDREGELEETDLDNKEQRTEQLDVEPEEGEDEKQQGTRDKPLATEYDFSDDMFLESVKEKKYLSRAQKREGRLQHAKAEKKSTGRDWVLGLSQDELRRLQEKDKTLQNLDKGPHGPMFYKKNGLLYRQWQPRQQTAEPVEQLVLPQACRKSVLELAHTIPLAGHMGRDKTARRIQQRFYWPTLFKDVADYCQKCPDCQKTDTQGRRRVPLVPIPIVQEPFERIAMDIVGPLKRSRKGNRYILVVCDYATRFPEAIPLRSIDAETVAEELITVFSRFGIPGEILSDQGSNFMSQLMQELYRLLKVRPIRTSPYHPQTDGLVERFNRTLKSMLRRLVKEEGRDWDKLIPYVLFAYREVPQTTTGFSPFELLFGREVRGPLDVLKEEWEASEKCKESVITHILEIRERMEAMQEVVKENAEEAQKRQKRWYDRTARDTELKPDDKVLVLLPTSTNKLLAQWKGPYKVIRKIGKVNYEIQVAGKKKVFHANMLKRWHEATANYFCEELEESVGEDDLMVWEGHQQNSSVTINGSLKKRQRKQLEQILHQFKEVLRDKPGRTSVTEHHINTKSSRPVRQTPYRIPYAYRAAVDQELRDMVKEGVIEPSKSSWASPIVIVKKKDNSLRVCVDYRKLNAETEIDAYPMPRIDDILDQIGQAKYLSTLDLARGYWQVPVANEDRHKTAFTTPFGLYQFTVMPFGLSGTPATFQRLMDHMTDGIHHFAHAYLDDLVIFSSTWEEHLEHLSVVLARLEEAGLSVKPSKCQFAVSECIYLGHVIGGGRVLPVKDKLEAISSFPVPEEKKQVRSFLGLAGYYRRFIPDFATVAAPLTDLTKSSEPQRVNWTRKCEEAFRKLKVALSSSPVLQSPDFTRPFVLQTDASEVGVGAVLSQRDDEGLDHPISYFSRKLLPRECNYSTIEKECLAIKLSVEAFQVYLTGRPFTIQTDHRALQWLDNMKDSRSRLTRWSLSLQPFKFNVEHRKGRDNANADTLSRIGTPKPCFAHKKEGEM